MPIGFITGGHGGIGFSAARHLASHYGWDLILAGRSPAKMEAAAERLRREAGVHIRTIALDLSSLASVRAAAAELRGWVTAGEIAPLDGMLLNAGGRFDGPVAYSPGGIEMTFASNALGHFALANLTADLVSPTGRLVFTASGTHDPDTADGRMVGAVVEPDAWALAHTGKDGKKPISVGKRYSTSKLVNILNAYELNRRLAAAGQRQIALAFDPGMVLGTEFLRGAPRPVQWLSRTSFLPALARRMGITMGSLGFSGEALARVAADPAYAAGGGKYFQSNDGQLIEARSSALSYDAERAKRLWMQMADMADLRPEDIVWHHDDEPKTDRSRDAALG